MNYYKLHFLATKIRAMILDLNGGKKLTQVGKYQRLTGLLVTQRFAQLQSFLPKNILIYTIKTTLMLTNLDRTIRTIKQAKAFLDELHQNKELITPDDATPAQKRDLEQRFKEITQFKTFDPHRYISKLLAKGAPGGSRFNAGRKMSQYGKKNPCHISLYDAQRAWIVAKYGSVQKMLDGLPWKE